MTLCASLNQGDKRCLPWRNLGESCDADEQCGLYDAYCKQGTCAPFARVGEPCADTTLGKRCWYAGDGSMGCHPVTNRCTAASKSGPCVYADDYGFCAAGYECGCETASCSQKVCKPSGKLGAGCDGVTQPYYCANGLSCDWETEKIP